MHVHACGNSLLQISPKGVSCEYNQEKSVLVFRLRSPAKGLPNMFIVAWLILAAALCALVEAETQVLLSGLRPIMGHFYLSFAAQTRIYSACLVLCTLILTVIMRFTFPLFRTRITVSASSVEVSGFPKCRFDVEDVSLVQFKKGNSASQNMLHGGCVADKDGASVLTVSHSHIADVECEWLNAVLKDCCA